ncbi:unknown [Acidaminococcus sp. CAG:917]|nr:unknown [Acidaminococcus sp. CAG:917]
MEDRCVCCGALIPEGKMVCPICSKNVGIGQDAQKPNKTVLENKTKGVGNSVKTKTLD